MLEYLRRRREDDQGFTLIELMVVVLIIAILIAIAIPTFLGAQNRARDRAAQSDIRNALAAAVTIATDNEGFFRTDNPTGGCTAITATDLADEESSLSYVAVASTSADGDNVGFVVESEGSSGCALITFVRASAKGSGDKWFCLTRSRDGETGTNAGAALADVDSSADCGLTSDEW